MLRLIAIVILALTTLWPACGNNAQVTDSYVSISAKHCSLRSIMLALLESTNSHYAIVSEAPDVYVADLQIKDVPFDVALAAIAKTADLTCTRRNDTYLIGAKPNAKMNSTDEKKELEPLVIEPDVTEGMSKYEVKQILGQPRDVVYSYLPGCEIWRYNRQAVTFHNARVYKNEWIARVTPIDLSQPASKSRISEPDAYAVDPADLDKLVSHLKKRVDSDSDLRVKVAKSQIAVMKFALVDITAPSVASNLADDLSTAMINNGFHVAERAQLDKILQELKIEQTGLVASATLQNLGQMSGCPFVLLGSISDRGTSIVINARIVETATAKALCAERIEIRKTGFPKG